MLLTSAWRQRIGTVLTIAAIGLLVLSLLVVGWSGLSADERCSWKSAAGGIGISYAFLVLLPKIAAAQEVIGSDSAKLYGFFEHHAYLVALAGLVLHYGLDVAVERVLVMPSRKPWRFAVKGLVVGHASSLFGYFLLIGYLVAETPPDQWLSLVLFTFAMAVHALAMGHGLRQKYGGLYDRFLRWVFAAALVTGGLLAVTTEIPYGTRAVLTALFAGMLIMATIKEKIPGSSDARFGPFVCGVVSYSLLLLLAEQSLL